MSFATVSSGRGRIRGMADDAPLYCEQEPPSQQLQGPACWKCEGSGILRHRKRQENPVAYAKRYGASPPPCAVCAGAGRLPPKQKQREHAGDAGVVTERRWVPPEWERDGVPGPPTAGVGEPERGEELCFLTGGWRIFQRVGGHRYTTEDVVTAWTAARSLACLPARALDLGTGIGSVLMMTAWRFPAARAVGVEAQELSATMAKRSLQYNGADVDGRCEVRHADIRDSKSWLRAEEAGSFDLVTGTPPYFPVTQVSGAGSTTTPVAIGAIGALPTCRQSAPARYEFRGGIEAYCEAAVQALRCPDTQSSLVEGADTQKRATGGRFVVCEGFLDGNRARVHKAAAASGLRVLEQTDVIGREGKDALFATYVMCHGDDPAQPAPGEETKTLVVRDGNGDRTAEYCALMTEMGMPCGVAGRDFD